MSRTKNADPAPHTTAAIALTNGFRGNPDFLMLQYREMAPYSFDGLNRSELLNTYQRMVMDDRISQVLEIVNRAVKNLKWHLEGEHEQAKKFIEKALQKLDMKNFIENLLTARIYGFAVFEELWSERDGFTIIEERLIPAERVEFITDQFGVLLNVAIDGKPLPVEWFHIFTYPAVRPPNFHYGESDLHRIYREWRTKDLLIQYRNLGLENFAFPIVLVDYDETRYRQGTAEWDQLMAMISGIKDDARVALPAGRNPVDGSLMPGVKISFLQPDYSGNGFQAFQQAIESENKAITRNLGLPDDLGFTDSGNGSYAKAREESTMFWQTVADIANKLEANIQKLVDKMIAVNFPNIQLKFSFNIDRTNKIIEDQ